MINDLRNLQQNGRASVAELRDFLKTLKARNPQEVIGVVSTNLLIQSLVLSCILTVLILAVFTVGPYLAYGPGTAAAPKRPAAAPAASPTTPARPDETQRATAAATPESPATPDVGRAAKALGIDETKPAEPGKNPLDKPDLDKLLDGL